MKSRIGWREIKRHETKGFSSRDKRGTRREGGRAGTTRPPYNSRCTVPKLSQVNIRLQIDSSSSNSHDDPIQPQWQGRNGPHPTERYKVLGYPPTNTHLRHSRRLQACHEGIERVILLLLICCSRPCSRRLSILAVHVHRLRTHGQGLMIRETAYSKARQKKGVAMCTLATSKQ